MQDSANQTLFAALGSTERLEGLVYSQFYRLVKAPFNTSKAYVFKQDTLKNLALDPSYAKSLKQEGRASVFTEAACKKAYLHIKQQAHVNLRDNSRRSYRIQEEHQISLAIIDEVKSQWTQQDLYSAPKEAAEPALPYYIIPTKELFTFLYAQINNRFSSATVAAS
ncbi:hypothetical protein SLS61_006731 [Didymella pomorum]